MSELSALSRYTRYGARDDEARAAGNFQRKRWKVRASRNDGRSTLIPVDVVAVQLADLYRAGVKQRQLADHCHVRRETLTYIARRESRGVKVETAEAIRGLWELHCAPLEPDSRTWPTEPLREALKQERGALDRLREENPSLYRYIYRSPTVDLERADMAATKYLSGGPESVWPGWFGIEEVA